MGFDFLTFTFFSARHASSSSVQSGRSNRELRDQVLKLVGWFENRDLAIGDRDDIPGARIAGFAGLSQFDLEGTETPDLNVMPRLQ